MANEFVINTELNTDGVVSGAEDIKKVLENAGDTGAEAGRKLGQNIEKGLNSALNNVKESMNKALVIEDGGNAEAGIQSLIDKYIELKAKMDEIGAKRDDILNQQSAIADNVNGDLDTRYYKELEKELDELDAKYGQFGERVETIGEALRNAGVDVDSLGQEQEELAEEVEEVGEKSEKTSKKMVDLGKSMNKAEAHSKNMSNSFKDGLRNILKYAFGISTLFVLFNKLRGAVKEGYGNLENSSEDVKATMDSLTNSLGMFKNQIASAFQPILSMVVPILTSFINVLTQVIAKISEFFAVLTGQNYFYKATKGVNDLSKGLGGASKKAKELKNYTSGLDELNVLSKPDEDEAGGGGGGANGFESMFEKVDVSPEMLATMDKLKEKAKEVADRLAPLGNAFLEGWKSATKNINMGELEREIKHVAELVKDIFTDPKVVASAKTFATKASKALGQIVGATVSIGFSITDNLFGGIERWLEQDSDKIKEHISTMFEIKGETIEMWGNFAEAVADVFSVLSGDNAKNVTADVFGIIGESIMGVSEVVAKLQRDLTELTVQPFIDNVEGVKTTLDGLFGNIDTILSGIKDAVGGMFDDLNAMYDERIKPLFDSLTSGFSDTFSKALEAYNTYLKPFIDELSQTISDLWTNKLEPAFQNVMTFIGSLITRIQAVYENTLKPMFDWIMTNVIQNVMPIIIRHIQMIIDFVGNVIAIIGDMLEILGGVIDFITGVFTGDWELAWQGVQEIFDGVWSQIKDTFGLVVDYFSDIWDEIWEGAKGAINLLISGFETMVNNIIKGLNKIIEGINQAFTFDLPDVLGGGSVSLGIPTLTELTLPRLAQGAVIPPNREFMAVLGDQSHGTNIEAPLDTIKQALVEVLDDSAFLGYLASISDYTRISSEKEFNVSIGDREIARANLRGQKQMGRTLITSV